MKTSEEYQIKEKEKEIARNLSLVPSLFKERKKPSFKHYHRCIKTYQVGSSFCHEI